MKVESSAWLAEVKPAARALLNALLAEYPYASLLACDSVGKRYRIGRSGLGADEDDLFTTRGFVVKVQDGKSFAEYSFGTLTQEDIPAVLQRVREDLIPLGENSPRREYPVPADEPRILDAATDFETDPRSLGDGAILNSLAAVRTAAMEADGRVLDCTVSAAWRKYSKMFLSRNRDMTQNVMWMTGGMAVLAARGEEIKDYYRSFSNLGGAEVLDRMAEAVPAVVAGAMELLDSQPITPGEYVCVCTPEVTGMIVHEAFGHGVEMDMFVKDRALAARYVGKQVASPLVTMHDGAAAPEREVASCFFDDEGVEAGDTVIIKDGVLQGGICDAQSAMALGTAPTGNGRRESWRRKAYTRMTNTYFTGGTDRVEDMIASVEDGFLLDNPSSGMEDPKNWGIQCMVNVAREIKGGKLTGRVFSPVVLTGYVPDLLKSITMMSGQVELGGGGFCGKGYKEWVKVSDGGPWIKATIRLG